MSDRSAAPAGAVNQSEKPLTLIRLAVMMVKDSSRGFRPCWCGPLSAPFDVPACSGDPYVFCGR